MTFARWTSYQLFIQIFVPTTRISILDAGQALATRIGSQDLIITMAVIYSEAISRISTYLEERSPRSSSLKTDVVRLEQSVGRTLARDYEATIDAPPFDNSGERI